MWNVDEPNTLIGKVGIRQVYGREEEAAPYPPGNLSCCDDTKLPIDSIRVCIFQGDYGAELHLGLLGADEVARDEYLHGGIGQSDELFLSMVST